MSDRDADRAAADAGGDDAGDADGEWRFGLEDVGEDGRVRPTVEPGTPAPENVAFFLLGVAVAVLAIAALAL